MAIIKCKMCGGDLEVTPDTTVAECEYCGTKQTLPRLDDDRKANLYDRANHFRRNNEFDKAAGIYEQILNEDGTDAETYWSLVLCRYGIEYVEDPSSHKRFPTINRAQFTSVFDDDNYKSALQYADSYQKVIYEAEAKAINEIQRDILAISQKEEPFDVFVCYKETDHNGRRTPDSVLAQELYYQFTQEGFKVFFSRITLEDKLGSAYEPYIFAALNSAKVMVVIGTKPEYFKAVWVRNEWSRYLSLIKSGAKKTLIPAYKDMDPYDLPEEFSHLQAQDMSKLGFMQDLIRGIKKIVGAEEPKTAVIKETVVAADNTNTAPLLKRAFLFLEDSDWNSADEYCEKVLDVDPECAEAYLGKLMVELRVRTQEDLKEQAQPFDNNSNYQKAFRFGDTKIRDLLEISSITIREASGKKRREQQEKAKKARAAIRKGTFIAAGILFLLAIVALVCAYFYQKTPAGQFVFDRHEEYVSITNIRHEKVIKDGVLSIPAEINGLPVKYFLGTECGNSNITILVVPETLDSLTYSTLQKYPNLERIRFCGEPASWLKRYPNLITTSYIIEHAGACCFSDWKFTTTYDCEKGGTQTRQCLLCKLVETQEILAKKHTLTIRNAVSPTCTTAGKTEGQYCSVCLKTLVAQTPIDKLPHTEVVDNAVAPTYTSTGLTKGSHCSVCNTVLVAQKTIDKLDKMNLVGTFKNDRKRYVDVDTYGIMHFYEDGTLYMELYIYNDYYAKYTGHTFTGRWEQDGASCYCTLIDEDNFEWTPEEFTLTEKGISNFYGRDFDRVT